MTDPDNSFNQITDFHASHIMETLSLAGVQQDPQMTFLEKANHDTMLAMGFTLIGDSSIAEPEALAPQCESFAASQAGSAHCVRLAIVTRNGRLAAYRASRADTAFITPLCADLHDHLDSEDAAVFGSGTGVTATEMLAGVAEDIGAISGILDTTPVEPVSAQEASVGAARTHILSAISHLLVLDSQLRDRIPSNQPRQ